MIIKDNHFENICLHILGVVTYQGKQDVRIHITSDFVEWFIGENFIWDGEWNKNKHGYDVIIDNTPKEIKRLIELKETKTKGKRWVNSFTVNYWSANKMQEGETIIITAFDENGRLGYILEAEITQEACDKGKEKHDRPVEQGKNKGSKISISYEMLKRESMKIHYANAEAVNKHYPDARLPNNLYVKELCLERAKNPLPEVTNFIDTLKKTLTNPIKLSIGPL